MRLLRPFLFLITTCSLAASVFASQRPSPTKTEKPELRLGPAVKIPTAANRPILITPRDSDTAETSRHQGFDKGIYAPRSAGGQSMCAAIMSYNFTAGENPQLKNVTTCTPARPQSVYRTRDGSKHLNPRPPVQLIAIPQDLAR
jgi:hypothetical protein